MNQDQEHLRLLSIFHYVVGGLHAVGACIPFIHLGIGIAIVSGAIDFDDGKGPPPAFGWLFIVLASLFIVVGWTLAGAILLAGRFLARKTHYTYCLVVAAIECIFMPFGTILGVFTIVVLSRSTVRPLFEPNAGETLGP